MILIGLIQFRFFEKHEKVHPSRTVLIYYLMERPLALILSLMEACPCHYILPHARGLDRRLFVLHLYSSIRCPSVGTTTLIINKGRNPSIKYVFALVCPYTARISSHSGTVQESIKGGGRYIYNIIIYMLELMAFFVI